MVLEEGGEEMLPEEYRACLELYRMQFTKLSAAEKLELNKLVDSMRKGSENSQSGGQSLGLVRRNNNLLKRKQQSLNSSLSMLPDFDGYVPPLVPPIKGLDGLIKECSSPFEKQLTVTDLKDDQSRLAFSRHDAEKFLLPFVKGMDLKLGVLTTVYDMEGNKYPMTFKNWCDKYYVLTSGWKEFYKSRDLKPVEDFVTVWMFRHGKTKELCFGLSSRRRGDVHHLIRIARRKIVSPS